MPTKPNKDNVHLQNTGSEVLNAIRNEAPSDYRAAVPTANPENIRSIGAIILGNSGFQNDFLNALVNRIGLTLVRSKNFYNPLSMFKRGMMEYGETVEEVFVDIATPHKYDPAVAEREVFKREIPDVKSAFHTMNYQHFYKATVQRRDLERAFLSESGVVDLAEKIASSLYAALNYDEFQVMKYLIAFQAYHGRMFPVTLPSTSNKSTQVSIIKGVSNAFTFPSREHNLMGVMNSTDKDDQFILLDSRFDAAMDVEVLAAAFNMDKADFMGHRVLIDSFGSLDIERLNKLFKDDPNYHEFSTDELKELDGIPAVLLDRDWFMVFDNVQQFDDMKNGQSMSWNYFLHAWKTFSSSPFAQNAIFVPGTPAVKSVAISPATVSSKVGQGVQFTATVDTDFFAPQAVDWLSNSANVEIDKNGYAKILPGATGTVTITARSKFDTSKSSTASLTIS